jgi:hypothetical protein
MSLPPSSHPSPDHQSQAGASAIAWWQENFDKISEVSIHNAPAPTTTTTTTKPVINSQFPPSRITIPCRFLHKQRIQHQHHRPNTSSLPLQRIQLPSSIYYPMTTYLPRYRLRYLPQHLRICINLYHLLQSISFLRHTHPTVPHTDILLPYHHLPDTTHPLYPPCTTPTPTHMFYLL